jgi:hypothetical protein
MANRARTRTTQLYGRRREELSLGEVEGPGCARFLGLSAGDAAPCNMPV